MYNFIRITPKVFFCVPLFSILYAVAEHELRWPQYLPVFSLRSCQSNETFNWRTEQSTVTLYPEVAYLQSSMRKGHTCAHNLYLPPTTKIRLQGGALFSCCCLWAACENIRAFVTVSNLKEHVHAWEQLWASGPLYSMHTWNRILFIIATNLYTTPEEISC